MVDKRAYEAPALTVIGSLKELTLQNKDFGQSDGFQFQGADIANAS